MQPFVGRVDVGDQVGAVTAGAGLDVGVALLRLGYIGVSSPVRAQVSRLTSASALRARWVSTWPRVQPGSSEGSRAWSSVRPCDVGETGLGRA